MTSLQVAGSAMVSDGAKLARPAPAGPAVSTLGVRSLREEYLKPAQRGDIPRNLKIIEERFDQDSHVHGPIASEERLDLPRFHHLFQSGELLPAGVFFCALEMGPSETLNGQTMHFDPDVLALRDQLVMSYKPLVAKIRLLHSKEIEELPMAPVLKFVRLWTAWESAWLRNREVHAVEALQPLAKAILALEPLLLSADKEKLLPWPRVQHQKVVTLKCLDGFIHALRDLASSVLPSLSRELDHDPKLLLLMEHVLALRGEKAVVTCLEGVSATPDVTFPSQKAQPRGPLSPSPGPGSPGPGGGEGEKGLTLDAYAFTLLGTSVGDAAAAGKLGDGHAARAKLAVSGTAAGTGALKKGSAAAPAKENDISRRSAAHAAELLRAFEGIKDMLLSLKSTLEHVDPALDRDGGFVQQLQRFEKAFGRAKRLFLEPDNLA